MHTLKSQGSTDSLQRKLQLQLLAGSLQTGDLDEILSQEDARSSMLSADENPNFEQTFNSAVQSRQDSVRNNTIHVRDPGSQTPSAASLHGGAHTFNDYVNNASPAGSPRHKNMSPMRATKQRTIHRNVGPATIIQDPSNKLLKANPDAKLSFSKSDRNPTLPEKLEIVNKWYASVCGKDKNYRNVDVSIDVISELLVSKQLVSDRDTGVKFIMKQLQIREADRDMSLNYSLFQRLFVRCIFKQSLVEVLDEIKSGSFRQNLKAEAQPPNMRISRSPSIVSPAFRQMSLGGGSAMEIV